MRQHRRQCCLGLVDAEIGKVAVGPPSINHRVRIDAGSKGRLRLTESHLRRSIHICKLNYNERPCMHDASQTTQIRMQMCDGCE